MGREICCTIEEQLCGLILSPTSTIDISSEISLIREERPNKTLTDTGDSTDKLSIQTQSMSQSSTETVDLRIRLIESLEADNLTSPTVRSDGESYLAVQPENATPDGTIDRAPDPGGVGAFEEIPLTQNVSFSSTVTGSRNSKRVSVNVDGTAIDTEHNHYDLSVAMMLGIRFSVEKSAFDQRKRVKAGGQLGTLRADDFIKTEKYVFPYTKDVLRNDPVHTLCREWLHTFKFRAYAPLVFAQIRRSFGVDRKDFIESLCGNSNFIEFMSNSNSGEFFFYSNDGRYMIKTQTYQEIKFMRKILPMYYEYLQKNPNSFITHYYGLYHVKIPHLSKNVPFVIMKSVFDTEKRIHTIYDLKGSTQGRRAKRGHVVLKDMDLMDRGATLHVGSEKKTMITEQLEKDAMFLSSLNIMDYSLLVGVHHRKENVSGNVQIIEQTASNLSEKDSVPQPNFDNLREVAQIFLQAATDGEFEADDRGEYDEENDSVMSPSGDSLHVTFPTTRMDSGLSLGSMRIRPTLSNMDHDSIDSNESRTEVLEVTDASEDRIEVLWVTASNGISGREDNGIESYIVDIDTMLSKDIFYIGIIDILQQYNTRKYVEHTYKASYLNEQDISCVDPDQYAKRFVSFCSSVLE